MKTKQIFILAMAIVVFGATGCTKTKTCKIKSSLNATNAGSAYFYDGDNLSDVRFYGTGGTLSSIIKPIYDINGKIGTIKTYDLAGNLSSEIHIAYDINNNLTGIYQFADPDNDGAATTFVDYYAYTYNSDGTIDEGAYYDATYTLQYTATYTWVNGNITSIEYQPLNTEYVFEYDDHPNYRSNLNEFNHIYSFGFSEMSKNNMTKIEYYVGGILNSSNTRTYTYNGDGSVESDNGYYMTYDCIEE